MARIEKTVFISYRRTDMYKALAVYQDLTSRGYDVFLDYTSIHAGDFEQIIVSNIRARAHFVLILTPTALDGCSKPDDWLRREIETAIEEKRNIVPLFFDDFSFNSPTVAEKLTGKLAKVKRFNGLRIPSEYFTEAMDRLSENFLSDPFDAEIYPVSNEVQRVVEEEQSAANKALLQEAGPENLSQLESRAIRYELQGKFWNALQCYYAIKRIDPEFPRVDIKIRELEDELKPKTQDKQDIRPTKNKPSLQLYRVGIGILFIIALGTFGTISIRNFNASRAPTSTLSNHVIPTETAKPILSTPSLIAPTDTASALPPTSVTTLSVGDTMVSPKDGMTLLYIPAGKFEMGSTGNEADERPVHDVYLNAFFMDQTEVTNAMYAICVNDGKCEPPRANTSYTQNASNGSFYYGNPLFDSYPVIFVSWVDARNYCKWADRRLPTEAEWEKAATWDAGKEIKRIYPWGNKIDCTYANYYGKGNDLCVGDTSAVGSYPDGVSFYGILDMAGNVWEWVADRYDPEYYGVTSEYSNPTGPRSGDYIVIRGGSFLTGRATGVRSSDRDKLPPDNTSHNIGFRCAMDAD